MDTQTNRRNFLRIGVGGLTGVLAASKLISNAIGADSCLVTPRQTLGPFYPGEKEFGQDVDLTRVAGSSTRALGQVIYIKGRVVDHLCRPVSGANVEIWQACATGRYNNAKDPNVEAVMDLNFKYWAETFTNANGEYLFKSIIPGAYPADTNWDRPPHVHFKVSKLGFKEIVTQMYFKGERLNELDLIWQELSILERESVTVEFKPSVVGLDPRSLTGTFDISLKSVRNV